MPKYAVILLNMGGPDSLDSVEPFLFHLFSDHDIFRFPFAQKQLARFISRLRAPKAKSRYEEIGGKSPINEWTEKQRTMLERAMNKELPECHVHTAMRYWHPMIPQTAEKVAERDYERVVLLPLYPQYSITTTGSSFNEWKRSYGGDHARVTHVQAYYDHPKYIDAINERIDEAIIRFPEPFERDVQILFSAHGTPERFVKEGDPYSGQIQKTVSMVMAARDHSHAHHLCFQSRVGPVKWLGPSTVETLKSLAGRNIKNLVVVPISFVSDHVETLHELDIEYRLFAEKLGIANYVVMKGLNDSETFIDALKDIAVDALLSKKE